MTGALPAPPSSCVWKLLIGNRCSHGIYLLFSPADSNWQIPQPSTPLCHFHHVPRPLGPSSPGSPDFCAGVSFISLRLLSSGSPPHTSAPSNATFYRCIGRGRTRVLQLRKYNRLAVHTTASRCGPSELRRWRRVHKRELCCPDRHHVVCQTGVTNVTGYICVLQ